MMGNSAPRQRSVLGDPVLTILLVLTTRVQAADPVFTGRADPPDQLLSLWYSRPAGEWLEAVPVGNGRLGGMVYGGVTTERSVRREDRPAGNRNWRPVRLGWTDEDPGKAVSSRPEWTWENNALPLATDPVAMDHVLWKTIDAKRKEKGLPPVGASGKLGLDPLETERFDVRQPQHIRLAANLGLGIFEFNSPPGRKFSIDHKIINLA